MDSASGWQPIIDCHSDVVIDVYRRRQDGERSVLARHHLAAQREGGVVAAVCTVGGDGIALSPLGADRPYESALAKLEALYADVAESGGVYEIVTSRAEIEDCVRRGVFAIIPSFEGASPLEGNLSRIEEFYDRGVRVFGLTWNGRNELAVGTGGGEGGLSELGVEAISLLNDLGVLIDLSHASPQTFADVAAITRTPLFASHSNASALWPHPRNLDGEQLRAVASSGGVVGVNFYPDFIGPRPVTLDHLLDHVIHLVDTIGPISVALGPDFIDYAVQEMRLEIAEHSDIYEEWSIDYPLGAETVRSMKNVILGMADRGLNANTIEKIAYGNFLRLFGEAQALAHEGRP